MRVRECTDPTALGVHPATSIQGADQLQGSTVPPYVQRDADLRLEEAFKERGLVIIEGPSAAGKSRLAYEAMQRCVPNRYLIVPERLDQRPSALQELVKAVAPFTNAVVWLDDMERYVGPNGITESVIDKFAPPDKSNVVLLATLRSAARGDLAPAETDIFLVRAVQDLMRRAKVIRLEQTLTDEERIRAEPFRNDERIAAALDQKAGVGFAEYLAAGPTAVDRWKSARDGAHITAGAIISAAIDVRASGHRSPIPLALLDSLHADYLSARDTYDAERPTFLDGLRWACERLQGASACLTLVGNDTCEPFDYLVDFIQKSRPPRDIPEFVWPAVLGFAHGNDLFAIGTVARIADRQQASAKAFQRAYEESGGMLVFDSVTDLDGAQTSIISYDEGFVINGTIVLPAWLISGGRICIYAEEIGGSFNQSISCIDIDIVSEAAESGSKTYPWTVKFPGQPPALPRPQPNTSNLYQFMAVFTHEATHITSFIDLGPHLIF
jgi:hypothetical protein